MNQIVKFSAVIFDMDGLMLDTEGIAQVSWQSAAADWGLELLSNDYQVLVGRSVQEIEDSIYKILGAEAPFSDIRKRKQQYFEENITKQGIPLKPGLLELLELLDQLSLLKAVASSTDRKSVIKRLTIAGLFSRFDTIVGGDEVQNGKPAPDIFLKVATQLRISPKLCIVLEDSDAGVRAAYTAGMVPIMVPDLKKPTEESLFLAHRIFPSLNEVRTFLQEPD